jgi:rod shape-determining protein MreD
MSQPIKFLLNFFVIMAIQLFILDDMILKSSITLFSIPAFIPLIYPLILLVMPVNTPSWLTMLLGFIIGIIMDTFNNTPGLHAAAGVLLGFIRPRLLALFFQKNIKDLGEITPGLYRMGITSFTLYIAMAIVVHHFLYYFLQEWSIGNFFVVLFKTIVSGIISILLILIMQLIFAKRDMKRT